MIKSRRADALTEIYALIEQTITRYQSPKVLCGRSDHLAASCDAMVLGSLLKESSKAGIWPPPVPPYAGVDFDSLIHLVQTLEVTAVCDEVSRVLINGSWPDPGHGLQALFEEKIEVLEERLSGLSLDDFVKKSLKRANV